MVQVKTITRDLEYLRQVSDKVNFKKDDLSKYINVLDEYCKSNSVFAMAAIQLGIPKRIIYLKNTSLEKVDDDIWNEREILINPVIVKREGITSYWEACASCLDNTGLVLRPYKFVIRYRDLNNKIHQKTFSDFSATVLSHEFDHLDGILHMDRALEVRVMTKDERREFRKTHDYEVIKKNGDYERLEGEYRERYKN